MFYNNFFLENPKDCNFKLNVPRLTDVFTLYDGKTSVTGDFGREADSHDTYIIFF